MSEIKMSPEIGELVKALALAQTEFKPVFKDTDNPYFSSKYADLSGVIAATQPALAKNGLVVMQSPIVDLAEQKAGVLTMLAHSSGQWLSNDLLLPATMRAKEGTQRFDAQSVGSAITYARRYSYQAIVGVAAEVDDDGNAATGKNGSKESAQAVAARKITDYKAKKATGGDVSHAAEKQAPEGTGTETIVLTQRGDGLVALSGSGLTIVRASMSKDDRDFFKVKYDGKASLFTLPAKLAFKFQDMCTRLNVGTQIMDAQTQTRGPMAPEKAVIPPMDEIPEGERQPSTDPILTDTKRHVPVDKNGFPILGKKPCLYVKWNGRDHSSFDKGIWPILESAKGKPIMLETKENGKYSNVVRILRVDGVSFEDDDEQIHPDGID